MSDCESKIGWGTWIFLAAVLGLFIGFPYVIGDRHSVVADLIHSLMFFAVFLAVVVVPFQFVYRGGAFGKGVMLVWLMFIAQDTFLAFCYASMPDSFGLPKPDLRGMAPALLLGWLPGLVVCCLAILSRLVIDRVQNWRYARYRRSTLA